MKLPMICVLCMVPAVSPAAEVEPSAWVKAAREAQAQLQAGRLDAAAAAAKQALQLAKRYGSSDARVASTYHLLGLIHREWGHCAEARSEYSHAIAIWKRQPNPNPKFLFNAMNNHIGLLNECDEFQAAEKMFRTYEPDFQRYRTDAMDDARIFSMRAMLARGRNDYAKSEEMFRESIARMEQAGARPIEIAAERSNLAVILGKRGHHEESLRESLRAIEFFEKAAPRNPTYIAALNNAACSLASLGRREEAERMFERALTAAAELYGEEDNRVSAKIMLSYARVLRENKEAPAAEAFQKKGSEAFRRSLIRDNSIVDAEELKAVGR